jgi:hypothetical protein
MFQRALVGLVVVGLVATLAWWSDGGAAAQNPPVKEAPPVKDKAPAGKDKSPPLGKDKAPAVKDKLPPGKDKQVKKDGDKAKPEPTKFSKEAEETTFAGKSVAEWATLAKESTDPGTRLKALDSIGKAGLYDKATVEQLEKMRNDPDPSLRWGAVWALDQIRKRGGYNP